VAQFGCRALVIREGAPGVGSKQVPSLRSGPALRYALVPSAPLRMTSARSLVRNKRGEKDEYRGRLDEGRTTPPRAGAPRELVEAMRAIANTGLAPADQKASIGCSIKWKDE